MINKYSHRIHEPYGDTKGLIVIDMQTRFLQSAHPDMRRFIPQLVERIADEVATCIYQGGQVIIVEYENHGNTVPRIRNAAHRGYQARYRSPPPQHPAIFLQKKYDSMLAKGQNMEFFTQFDQRRHFFTISGINASACAGRSAKALYKFGIPCALLAGLTLNVGDDVDRQRISRIKNGFKNPNLLHVPRQTKRLGFWNIFQPKSLTDYI